MNYRVQSPLCLGRLPLRLPAINLGGHPLEINRYCYLLPITTSSPAEKANSPSAVKNPSVLAGSSRRSSVNKSPEKAAVTI
eukprot:4948805-Amphidinium_carterae.1